MNPVQLVTLAPGHFHAALVQKEMLPGVDPHVHVYGPDNTDLTAHLDRVARFNARPDRPTAWSTTVHAGPDWLDRFRAERPGNVVVVAGRNRPKIDLILAAVSAGYCVLADKPWVIEAADIPKLEQVFAEADRLGVFAGDVMTERCEITTRIQRKLIHDPDVFGAPFTGTPDEPALELESVHYLSKSVAGAPLRRPAWWFDPAIAGHAVADVGTHLADLAMWLVFPDQPIDLRDVEIRDAGCWPTPVDRDSFREITGLTDYPAELAHLRDGNHLNYWGNGSVLCRLRDRFVRFTTRWGVRAAGPDGDTHEAIARGTRSTVTVRHDAAFGPGPQVFVTPHAESSAIRAALERSGHSVNALADELHVHVPPADRTGHEAHFAQVLEEFVTYFRDRTRIPAWERPNLLAKYYLTTRAVEIARSKRA
jgi:predicted dehydrogenase